MQHPKNHLCVFLLDDLFSVVVATLGAYAVSEVVFTTLLASCHCWSCELRVV